MDERQITRLERLLRSFERMQLDEYLNYVRDRPRLFWNNFLIGLARGLGTTLGVTVLGAVVVMFLQSLVQINIPLIGNFLAELVRIVQARLSAGVR